MGTLRWLLMVAGVAMFGTAAGVVAYDVYLAMQFQRLMSSGEAGAAVKGGPPTGQAGSPVAQAGLLGGQAGTSRPILLAHPEKSFA